MKLFVVQTGQRFWRPSQDMDPDIYEIVSIGEVRVGEAFRGPLARVDGRRPHRRLPVYALIGPGNCPLAGAP